MDTGLFSFEQFMKSMSGGQEKVFEQMGSFWKGPAPVTEPDLASTPYDTVFEVDRVKLKRYRPSCGTALGSPLLVVYALINRETMLDLQQDRSVVRAMLDAGVDVYMIDWGYPTAKDRYLTIDDHVNGYMDRIVDYILKSTGSKSLNLMGICMGGTFSVMYAALHPEKVKNLITTVTPTNFDTEQGLLHVWTRAIDADAMVDSFGNIPGDLMNIGFLMLNPARLMIDKYIGFFRNLSDKSFVENFVRMEKWIFDSPDVPGETFRQFIKDCYQKNLLVQNRLELGGRVVDLRKITMPVLNIYGKLDHLVPPEAADKLTKVVGSKDVEDVCLDTGHIGIYVSSKSVKGFTPKIVDWLLERNLAEGYVGTCSGSDHERVKSAKKRKAAKE
jgi:polyhydroxyalkanoate synthase